LPSRRARRVLDETRKCVHQKSIYCDNFTMLAIEKSQSHKGRCTPNVLPCRINHNGPVDASKRYWNPTRTPGEIGVHMRVFCTDFLADGKTVAYFRGRKLHGKQLKIPKGYRGVVVSSTDRILPKSKPAAQDDEEAEEEADVKIMEEQSEFDHIMLWGHEALPDEVADLYVRGIEEWIALAEQVRSPKFERVNSDISRSIPRLTKKTRWRKTRRRRLRRSGCMRWRLIYQDNEPLQSVSTLILFLGAAGSFSSASSSLIPPPCSLFGLESISRSTSNLT